MRHDLSGTSLVDLTVGPVPHLQPPLHHGHTAFGEVSADADILAVTVTLRTRGALAIRPLTIAASKKPRKMTVICRSDSNRPLHRRAGRPVLKGSYTG